MRILCAGPESSGTRMLTALLAKTGAEVVHSSPAFKAWEQRFRPYNPYEYDAVVLIIRNGVWNAVSMEDRGRFRRDKYEDSHVQIAQDIHDVLDSFISCDKPIRIVTYESLVYETEACIASLCNELGLEAPTEFDEIKNGNEKFWKSDVWKGDDRDLTERI